MYELFLALLAGILLGTFTGLIPGIHINLVALVLLSLSSFFLYYVDAVFLSVIILSMSITHTFLDVIPSTYLGAPSEDTALSVLPNHRMLLEGDGYNAVKLATIGSLLGLVSALVVSPLLIVVVRFSYDHIQKYIPYVLTFSVLFLVFRESKKLSAFLVVLFSGVLGMIVLTFMNLEQPLFPLLSGLFGTSTLLLSLKESSFLPQQFFDLPLVLEFKKTMKSLGSALLGSSLVGFLPGVSSAQAAILSSSFSKNLGEKYFLLIVGAINTIVMVFGFVAYYTLEKARNGSVVVIMELLESFSFEMFLQFLLLSLVVAFFATFLTLKLSRLFGKFIPLINYKVLCLGIVGFLAVLSFLFSGWIGFLLLVVATFVGMLAPLLQVGRNHLMSCLIVPVIFFFLL